MRIAKETLNYLNQSIPDIRYEIGGILGAKNDVVSFFVLDGIDSPAQRPCSYMPNVDKLNHQIALWQKNNITFTGLFHTHFANVRTLSNGDKEYIITIMKAMPPHITELYFPIFILPKREFICYIAKKNNNSIEIIQDTLSIES